MGASMVDYRVGTVVWVRRKNGSWWPGRIVEHPPSNHITPTHRTPIKLLGRATENSRVDWYNLEKSKRVKAFRCGEFDDCIRKAESLKGGYPISADCAKKNERREDAILYALELEKQQKWKNKVKRPPGKSREERVGSVYRAKRSRYVYLSAAAESNNICNEKIDEEAAKDKLFDEHAWKLKKRLKVRNLNKMSGVKGDREENTFEDKKENINIMLIDADVKVHASYRGKHVPLVSLTSRLNGKAIVGHPIDIETIEEDIRSEMGPLENDDSALDNALLKPVWRTCKRSRTPVCYALDKACQPPSCVPLNHVFYKLLMDVGGLQK